MKAKGFSLMELMMVIAIIGVLTAIAIPSYRTWIQNTQIRSQTESFANAMRTARTEAIRRNVPVRFQITDTMTNTCALNNTGTNWVVSLDNVAAQCASAPSDSAVPRIIRKGAMTVNTSKVVPSSSIVAVSTFASTGTGFNTLTFTPLGRVSEAIQGGAWLDFTDNSVSTPRALRVTVTQSGQIRVCDPSTLLAVNDPRRCLGVS